MDNVSDQRLVAQLPESARPRHGVPSAEAVSRHTVALPAARQVLGNLLATDGVRVSPLGPGWSRDIDLHVTELPPADTLRQQGWLPLDRLLTAVGDRGTGRWAIVVDGQVVAGADLTTAAVPDPVGAVIRRAGRRREVRLREVLELRTLQRQGRRLPEHPVVTAAAALEAALGGTELAAFADRSAAALPVPDPVPLPHSVSSTLRRRAGAMRRSLRPRVVVGFSGVDGSGKSSLTRRVVSELEFVGVPACVVWTRPGMRLRTLAAAARRARRVLGLDKAAGVRSVASGQSNLLSRRGPLGWAWTVCISAAFAADVRRRHLGSHGVVLYDRHLLDALVTLRFVYAGVDLRIPEWIAHRALPRARLSLYLDVPAEVALSRKSDDLFGEHAVRRQLELYAQRIGQVPGVVRLDGRRSVEDLTIEVLTLLTTASR